MDAGYFTRARIALTENERRAFVYEVPIVLAEIARTIIAGDKQTECVPAFLARQLDGYVGIDNRSSVNGAYQGAEDVSALKKERTFLRKEDRETLVRGDYRCVSFDLSKIRIDREVDC